MTILNASYAGNITAVFSIRVFLNIFKKVSIKTVIEILLFAAALPLPLLNEAMAAESSVDTDIFEGSGKHTLTSPGVLHLSKGDIRTITLREHRKLRLSRRGIIHIEHMSGDQWRVVALQNGVLAIKGVIGGRKREKSIIDEESEKVLLTIKVTPQPTISTRFSSNQTHTQYMMTSLPLCHQQKLMCDQNLGSISGIVESIEDYLNVMSIARQQQWRATIHLSESAMKAIIQDLNHSFTAGYKATTINKRLIINGPCSKERPDADREYVDFISGGLLSENLAFYHCNSSHLLTYQMKAKFILTENSLLHQLGVNMAANGSGNRLISAQWAQIIETLDLQHHDQRLRVVGEPELTLTPFEPSTVESGGELLLSAMHPDDQDKKLNIWKKYGLKFTAMAEPGASNDQLLLDFSLALSHPGSASATTGMSLSHLQNKQMLQLNVPQILGVIDVNSNANASIWHSWLSEVPLIGPLFKSNSELNSHHRLIACITITKS